MQLNSAAFDVVKDPTLIINEEGQIVYANPASIAACGVFPDRVEGQPFPGSLKLVPEWPWTLGQLRELTGPTEYREFDVQCGKRRMVLEVCVQPLNPEGVQQHFLITCIERSLELQLYQKSLLEKEKSETMLNAATGQQAELLLANDRMERRLQQMSFLLKSLQKTRFVFEEKTIAHIFLDQILKDLRFGGGHYFSWHEDKGIFKLAVSVSQDSEQFDATPESFRKSEYLDFTNRGIKLFSVEDTPSLTLTHFFKQIQGPGVFNVAVMPIYTNIKFFGIFLFTNYMQAPVIDQNTAEFLKFLVEPVSIAFETAHLYRSSILDEVTGLDNSRYFSSRVAEEVVRARQQQSLLSVLLVDIDNFKSINEEYGFDVGNRVLHHVASAMKTLMRASDIIARHGRDEIVAAMPGMGRVRAMDYARRLEESLAAFPVEGPTGPIKVTVTTGISMCPEHGTSPADLLTQATQFVEDAKKQKKLVEITPEVELGDIKKAG
jgi:diguanylate cyclase (GGDEF)-like protein